MAGNSNGVLHSFLKSVSTRLYSANKLPKKTKKFYSIVKCPKNAFKNYFLNFRAHFVQNRCGHVRQFCDVSSPVHVRLLTLCIESVQELTSIWQIHKFFRYNFEIVLSQSQPQNTFSNTLYTKLTSRNRKTWLHPFRTKCARKFKK